MMIDAGAIGSGLAARLAQIAAAMARYDAFVFRPTGDRRASYGAGLPPDDVQSAARTLVLRALRSCSDASGWQVMRRLADGDATTEELSVLLGCPRLSAWEQANDLVQAGLAARELDGDRVGLTRSGHGMVDLVEAITTTAAAVAAAAAAEQ